MKDEALYGEIKSSTSCFKRAAVVHWQAESIVHFGHMREAVYQKVGLSRTESSAFVELVLKEITDCLEKGETVKLSSFGSFMVRSKGERIGRNPKTGTEVPISPRRVMVFKPSAILKQRINGNADAVSNGKDHDD